MSRLALVFVSVVLLGGCATSVTVQSDIPEPLVQKLPLTAKLQLADQFVNYIYEEGDKKRAISTLDFGRAQTDMFRMIFGHLFTLDELTELPNLVITPSLLEVQYNAPRETSLNIYEVFLKYRVKITDSSGGKIADWVIKGYGKTPTAKLRTASNAFNVATNVALRDVGAQMIIGLPKQSSIQALVASHQANTDSVTEQTDNEEKAK